MNFENWKRLVKPFSEKYEEDLRNLEFTLNNALHNLECLKELENIAQCVL
jgi:hypothetical protein